VRIRAVAEKRVSLVKQGLVIYQLFAARARGSLGNLPTECARGPRAVARPAARTVPVAQNVRLGLSHPHWPGDKGYEITPWSLVQKEIWHKPQEVRTCFKEADAMRARVGTTMTSKKAKT